MAAEFKIGRLRFTWAGAWQGAKFYNRDAVVEYNGKTYVCIEPHTSNSDFYADLYHVSIGGANTPYWQLNLEGQTWKQDWQTGQFYSLGNLVVFGGAVYRCVLEHTSSTFDADYAKWEIYLRSNKWNTSWQTDHLYGVDDIVEYGGIVYRCTVLHTSAATITLGLENDLAKWTPVIKGIVYRNNWTASARYRLNDVVKLGSDLYIATVGHTASSVFDAGNWDTWLPGIEYSTTWTNSTTYQISDIVVYGGYSYVSISSNNLNNIPSTSLSNWEVLTTGYSMENDWNSGTSYQVGDVVRKGGNLFVAVSDSTGEDPTAWTTTTTKSNPSYSWNVSTFGGTIIQGPPATTPGQFYAEMTFSVPPESQAVVEKWTTNQSLMISINGGMAASFTLSAPLSGGSGSYVAIFNEIFTTPGTVTGIAFTNTSDVDGILTVSSTSGVVPGMVVSGTGFTQGQTVVAIINPTTVTISSPANSTVTSGQDVKFVGVNYVFWAIVTTGSAWKGFWETSSDYSVGELVVWANGTYRCIKTHTSANLSRPDNDSLREYWILESPHARRNAGTTQGNIVTRNSNNVNIPVEIGVEDYVLRTSGSMPAWANILVVPDVYYVAPTGTDDPAYGTTWDKPWASIRYACETVAKGFFNQNANDLILANKSYMVEEMYAWMLNQKANSQAPFNPSSVFDIVSTKRDAGYIVDAVSYDITRGGNSRTVAAVQAYFSNGSYTEFKNNATDAAQAYIVASLAKLKSLMLEVINNTLPTTNYQESNITWASSDTYQTGDIVLYQGDYYESVMDNNINENPATSFNWTLTADPGLVTPQVIDNSKIKETGSDALITDLVDTVIVPIQQANSRLIPKLYGSNTATIMVKTGTYSEQFPIIVPDNVALVGDELRGVVVQPKDTVYTSATRSFSSSNSFKLLSVTGMLVDMPIQFSVSSSNDNFSGITLGTTYYVKSVDTVNKLITVSTSVGGATVSLANGQGILTVYAGDCLKDMFYVRNASGIRNMSMTGLAGSLSSINSFGTRRPTGPSYVSLDPGAGPDDTSVWITKRSPYIQNCTTFGVGAVGMKIDGYLHNGGNKSIVCNDFTQIISDGIGVWCTGPQSLTECVSVFGYYNYSAYFAEDGGRIRATNGNSSYGTYGVIAEGYDPTEVPISGQIDNKSEQVQASVQSAFGSQAQILTLAYNNAGSDYTELTTNLLKNSNRFEDSPWVTDGNVLLQQNLLSPIDEPNAWTFTGQTSSSDSSYVYQDITLPAAGSVYTALPCLNVTGSGNSATFDITVRSTAYFAQVNDGGTGYVVGSVVRIVGSQLGGKDGVNDCFLTITSLAGSSILGVSVSGTVPEGSATPHTFSIYAKRGTATSFDLELVYSGSESVSSSISFNFDTLAITGSNNGTNGLVPTAIDKLSLTNDWYRVWLTTYDSTGLNTNLRVKIYPRGKGGFAGTTRFYGAQLQLSSLPTFYLDTGLTRFSSYADFYIKGAGTGAVALGDEIRSNAVFQTRITDTGTGTGGRGYLTSSNNAQGGDNTSILLAGSDTNLANNYQSMRVFINSGAGAGQYGYISYFDSGSSKKASILKESFTPLIITATDSVNDELSTSSAIDHIYVDQAIQFIPTYYSTGVTSTSIDTITIVETVGGTNNVLLTSSTAKLTANMPIQFSGATLFGGVISNFTYYIKEIISSTSFTITTTPFGTALLLNSVVGSMTASFPGYNSYIKGPTLSMIPNMPITFTGTAIGGITVGSQYYVNDVIDSSTFTIATTLINTTITNTASTTNIVTTSGSTSGLLPLYPIVFSGTVFGGITAGQKYYVANILNSATFTITDSLAQQTVTATTVTSNVITVADNSAFIVDNPVVFRGNTFGGIVNETVYYVLALDGSTGFTVSLSPSGSAVNLTSSTGEMIAYTPSSLTALSTATGSMTATTTNAKTTLTFAVGSMNGTYSTSLFGNVVAGTTYYIKGITAGSPNKFTISETPGGSAFALKSDAGSMNIGALGWDHVNPGTPIASVLDNSSVYYVEPRLTYSSPSFSQTASTITTIAPETSWISVAYGNNTWMAIPSGNAVASKTTNGSSWTSVALPVNTTWTDIAFGNNYWVVISNDSLISSTGSRVAVSNSNGLGWRLTELPSKTTWSNVSYGNGIFVAIATGTSTSAYSLDFGKTWLAGSGLPNQTWTGLAYGSGIFVAVASSTNVAAYSTDGINWTSTTLPYNTAWADITYGNGSFMAVSATSAKAVYSRDGITWNESVKALGSVNKIAYGQGVFLALSASSTVAYTSETGVDWEPRTVTSAAYGSAVFGFTSAGVGQFITVAAQTVGSIINAGCTTKGRVSVTSGRITGISIWEPGSNYSSSPTLVVTDPNITVAVTTSSRTSNGTLGNPTFISRGQDYNTNSTTIKVNGGGYADTYQTGLTIIVKNLSALPGPGDNLTIAGNSKIYKVTNATVVYGTTAPNIKANIQVSPDISVALSPAHETAVTIRTKYSQCRLTGHDFLNIGYGNAVQSNYPNVPEDTILSPQDQAVEVNFGRVFYTSTDQDGNFKVGDLFGVEQATGIVTLSASQFGLTGLETLSLGGIAVGGASVVIRQFSTDSTFVANSNEVIPTQRAIKAYLTGRLSQGGSNTFTGQLIAGTVLVGGPDKISSTIPNGTIGSVVNMPALVKVEGQFGAWGGDGAALAFFMKSM